MRCCRGCNVEHPDLIPSLHQSLRNLLHTCKCSVRINHPARGVGQQDAIWMCIQGLLEKRPFCLGIGRRSIGACRLRCWRHPGLDLTVLYSYRRYRDVSLCDQPAILWEREPWS
jgi:hypothetical protein